jgi:hypothetical protein
MAKAELSEELQALYFPSSKEPMFVKVPRMNFLMIDGMGNPNTSTDFHQALEALYGVCYTMKFMYPKWHPIRDSRVMPLEALWWTTDETFDMNQSSESWQWKAMIMQPDAITRSAVDAAI